jgi:RimJ/RimL family protein N-acetyltransferase
MRNQSIAGQPVLETERLLLRRPDDGDIDAIIAIAGDWEVARRLGRVPHPYGASDARFFLDTIVANEWVWAITWKATGEFIGTVGLTPNPRERSAELGYYVARSRWGIGIVTEAARAVVDHGFHGLGLEFLTSGHFTDNPASGRVLGKLGFVEVGRAERPCLASGTMGAAVELRLRRAVPEARR